MTTLAPPTPVGASRICWTVRDALVIAGRSLRQLRHVPERLSDATVQPVIFVLLFAEVFGSAISVPGGGSYREYLLPGIFVQTIVFGSVGSAVGMATDRDEGVLERLRSLPIARGSILSGRLVAEMAQAVLGLAVTLAMGLLVSWRIHRGVGPTLAALALLALFLLAMTLLGTLVGLLVRSPDAVPGIFFPILFPLTFLANTFVPLRGLPGWLRAIAEWNPVSAVVAACRDLFGNPNPGVTAWPLEHAVPVAFAWTVGLVVVCGGLALARWRTVAAG